MFLTSAVIVSGSDTANVMMRSVSESAKQPRRVNSTVVDADAVDGEEVGVAARCKGRTMYMIRARQFL